MGVERARSDVRQSVHRGGPGKPASLFGRLQDYVVYTGVLGVVEVALGALALAGLLGALLGRNDAVRAFSVVVVLLGLLALFGLLVANRVEWRRRVEVDRRLLRNYCDTLEKRHGQQWQVKSWVQEVDVRPNGDVFERISVTVVVECDLLDFCSFTNGPNWDWPDRYRPKVKVKVRSVEVGYEGGTRFDYTSTWLSRSRLKTMVHLNEPAPRGSEISFVVDLEWPAKCAPLMQGYSADKFVVAFSRPLEFAQYVVVLPADYRVCFDKIGLIQGRNDYTLVSAVNHARQTETVLTVRDVPAYHEFGMRLDLKHEDPLP